jgi:hypothetical protein
MAGGEVLLKFLEIIFKTLCWLFIITSILVMPLTLVVKLGMIALAVIIVETPRYFRRDK